MIARARAGSVRAQPRARAGVGGVRGTVHVAAPLEVGTLLGRAPVQVWAA
jgi:hypothetical protein